MRFRVVGLGEILWDLLPAGRQLGGAPGNFAYHARALGAEASVISRVGNDELGREILGRLDALGLPRALVQIDSVAPTGTVTVHLDAAGVPQFTIHEGVAWDRLEATDEARRAVVTADVICFGSLAQRTSAARTTVQALVREAPRKALRIFDINLRQHYYDRAVIESSLRLASILKLNDAELPVLAAMFGLVGDDRAQVASLAEAFDLELVALTRGPRGSVLFQRGRWAEHRPEPVDVVDTVGAGDAFTATLAIGLLRGLSLDDIGRAANEVAAHVCTCAGATPALPRELVAKSGAPRS